ncbi:MAG: methionyl-tRNA formyltransferase [Verrucomicrobia bacterium]|nr:methionyl-tRNA formyltransferase [Verrucomicrobiota bacterium]
MKLLYMGTPASAATCLRRLAREAWPIAGVVTQPDRPKGRSRVLQPPPVKEAALELGLDVYQPEKASAPEFIDMIRTLAPDLTIVFAFGEIVSDAFLAAASISTINLHLSLLPAYRGAAPVQWAIVNGETATGVTVMHLAKRMDAGDIILQRAEPVWSDDTGGSLEARLATTGAELLIEAVRALEAGSAPRTPQDHARATFAPKLTKDMGRIDWTLPAAAIERRVRAFIPWPVAHTVVPAAGGHKLLRVLEAGVVGGHLPPGSVAIEHKALRVGTGESLLELRRVQLEGRREMTAAEFLAGFRLPPAATFGDPEEDG